MPNYDGGFVKPPLKLMHRFLIPRKTMETITNPCPNLSSSDTIFLLVKWVLDIA